MTYYPPSYSLKIAESKTQVVTVPESFKGDFKCKLSKFDTEANGYSAYSSTVFLYESRLNYTTGYIEPICFLGSQFVTKAADPTQ